MWPPARRSRRPWGSRRSCGAWSACARTWACSSRRRASSRLFFFRRGVFTGGACAGRRRSLRRRGSAAKKAARRGRRSPQPGFVAAAPPRFLSASTVYLSASARSAKSAGTAEGANRRSAAPPRVLEPRESFATAFSTSNPNGKPQRSNSGTRRRATWHALERCCRSAPSKAGRSHHARRRAASHPQ